MTQEYIDKIMDRVLEAVKKGNTPEDRKKNASEEVHKIIFEWERKVRIDYYEKCRKDSSFEEYEEVSEKEEAIKRQLIRDIREVMEAFDTKNSDTDKFDIKVSALCVHLFREWRDYIINCWPDKAVIKPRDIYKSLWRCRDFELSHLWQRSIFLTAFLVLCFTGYGAILSNISWQTENDMGFCLLNSLGLFVTIVGAAMSVLWIMMGKGSKMWYETYEKAIYKIERDPKYSERIVHQDMDQDEVMHGSLPEVKVKNRLCSTRAGEYSPSRINICIGQLSLFIWIVAYILHAILFSISHQLYRAFNPCVTHNISKGYVITLSLLFWCAIGIFAVCLIRCKIVRSCKSGGDPDEEQ